MTAKLQHVQLIRDQLSNHVGRQIVLFAEYRCTRPHTNHP